MRKLLRAGCLLAIASLSSCWDDSPGTPRSDEPAATSTQRSGLTTDTAGLVPTTSAKGTTVHLAGRFENAVIAHRHADGSIATECHDTPQEAEAFMQGTSASSAPVEVK
jgi:hypothetical protein